MLNNFEIIDYDTILYLYLKLAVQNKKKLTYKVATIYVYVAAIDEGGLTNTFRGYRSRYLR